MVRFYVVGLVAILLLITSCSSNSQKNISSFDDCVDAGYPVSERYPAECRAPNGTIFHQKIEGWSEDGMILMKNPMTGEVGCFGSNGTAFLTPEVEFEIVEETKERHCFGSFEIKE